MKGRTNQTILRPKLQRRLRSNMTDAEQRLWRFLRRMQMSGFKFRRQHPFGDYIIDFVCLEAMLAIEVDGGQHDAQQAEDAARTEYLERAGFRVLRFWNNEIISEIDSVTAVIWRALQKISPTPIPAFPLKGKEKAISNDV
jgi:very-short-patch-repair endonuclease